MFMNNLYHVLGLYLIMYGAKNWKKCQRGHIETHY